MFSIGRIFVSVIFVVSFALKLTIIEIRALRVARAFERSMLAHYLTDHAGPSTTNVFAFYRVVIGYDEGAIMVKLGREIPVASMDSSGKIIWAKHNEIQTANIKNIGAGHEV